MPLVVIEGPKIEVGQKRELVKKVTEVVSEVYGIKNIVVIVHENPPENVGVDGELVADRRAAGAS
jgi:4-oxalocrotonate tautomerase